MPATAPTRPALRDRVGGSARRDPRADDLSPAMRRAKELAGRPAAPAPPAARRHVSVPRLAPRARLTSLPTPSGEERRVDFVALTAVRIGATAAEVAAGRAAGEAMRAKLAARRAARSAPRPADAPAFVRPAPVAPAAGAARRYARAAA